MNQHLTLVGKVSRYCRQAMELYREADELRRIGRFENAWQACDEANDCLNTALHIHDQVLKLESEATNAVG